MLSKETSAGYDLFGRVRAELKARGYEYHRAPTIDMEHFAIYLYTLEAYELIQTIPYVATMQERPDFIAAAVMERRLRTLPDRVAVPPLLDLAGAVQLALSL